MSEDQRLKEAFMDLLNQHCGEYVRDPSTGKTSFKGYDSMCLSANECALELAVEFGWVKEEEVLR